MKKIIFSIVLSGVFATAAMAQGAASSDISICKKTQTVMSIAELQKCHQIITNDSKLKVVSFTVSYMAKSEDGKGVYVDYEIKGNELNGAALDVLNTTNKKFTSVRIDKVIAVDVNKNEHALKGIEYRLN